MTSVWFRTSVLVLAVLIPFAGEVGALTCAALADTSLDHYDAKEVLFVGVFLGYTRRDGSPLTDAEGQPLSSNYIPRNALARIRVSKAWKGVEERTAWLEVSDNLPAFQVGRPALVAIAKAPEPGFAMWMEPCSGSFSLGWEQNVNWEEKLFSHLGAPEIVFDEPASLGLVQHGAVEPSSWAPVFPSSPRRISLPVCRSKR